MLRRPFENVTQRSDKRIYTATEVLQIDEENIEVIHHRRRRPAHFAVQAKDRNPVHRIVEISRLDHIVLFVAAQPMLRAKGRGEPDILQRYQCVERVRQVTRDRGWMGKQCDTLSRQWLS